MIYLCILVHACSVWCCLVYLLFPVYPACESCLVLSCPALMSLLNIIIWVYILVRVFLLLPRVCTVTIPWHVHIKNRFQIGGGWLQSYSLWRIYDVVLYTVLCVTCFWRKIAIALDKTDPHGCHCSSKGFPNWMDILCTKSSRTTCLARFLHLYKKHKQITKAPSWFTLFIWISYSHLGWNIVSDRELLSEAQGRMWSIAQLPRPSHITEHMLRILLDVSESKWIRIS